MLSRCSSANAPVDTAPAAISVDAPITVTLMIAAVVAAPVDAAPAATFVNVTPAVINDVVEHSIILVSESKI